MAKQLKRSTSDSMLGGVCGGLGAYFSVDANLVRLLFVVFAVAPGFGVPVYLVLWLVLPEEASPGGSQAAEPGLGERVRDVTEVVVDRVKRVGEEVRSGRAISHPQAAILVGLGLVLVGLMLLLRNLGFSWMRWIGLGTVWPVLIILVGLAFLWRWFRGGA